MDSERKTAFSKYTSATKSNKIQPETDEGFGNRNRSRKSVTSAADKKMVIGDEPQSASDLLDEASNQSNQLPKMRLLDRSQLMDMMLFP